MTFQCPKCKGWNTDERGNSGVCYDCHTFYEMGAPEIQWKRLGQFVYILFITLIILYLIKHYFF